jgi:hypothetical protein
MQDVVLKPSVAIAGIALIFGLTAGDIWMVVRSARQSAIIETFANQQSVGLPKQGQLLPTLSGYNLMIGQEGAVIPAKSPPFALLIFRESCHFCEENWKNWEKLFGENGSTDIPVVLISSDKNISDVYRQKHPMLNKNTVLLGANAEILASIKLGLTPQTIYVTDGKIAHDWPGVLASEDMNEITETVSRH